MTIPGIRDPQVGAVFAVHPEALSRRLLSLRRLIYEVAATTAGVGELTEALRWGQPSYLTQATGSGTTLRLQAVSEHRYGLFVHCQTNLIDRYRGLFGDRLAFLGDRAVVFDVDSDPPMTELKICIGLALRYHADKPHSESVKLFGVTNRAFGDRGGR